MWSRSAYSSSGISVSASAIVVEAFLTKLIRNLDFSPALEAKFIAHKGTSIAIAVDEPHLVEPRNNAVGIVGSDGPRSKFGAEVALSLFAARAESLLSAFSGDMFFFGVAILRRKQ